MSKFATAYFIVFGVAAAVLTAWQYNRRHSRKQREAASRRPSLDSDDFVESLAATGVSSAVAHSLWTQLGFYCVEGVTPHPSDPLFGFYFDEGEELEDVLRLLFEDLRLSAPTRYAPEITPYINEVGALASYLEGKIASASAAAKDPSAAAA